MLLAEERLAQARQGRAREGAAACVRPLFEGLLAEEQPDDPHGQRARQGELTERYVWGGIFGELSRKFAVVLFIEPRLQCSVFYANGRFNPFS